MRHLLALAAALFLWVSLAHAESLSAGDKSTFQTIITGQLEAFRADDGARAYSYAAPMIRRTFPTPDTFMAMVQKGYPPVYRPRSYRFGEASLNASTLSKGRAICRI